jgi:hypothetical protein
LEKRFHMVDNLLAQRLEKDRQYVRAGEDA